MNSDVGGQLRYVIRADIEDFETNIAKVDKKMNELASDVNRSSSKAGASLGDEISQGASRANKSIADFVSEAKTQLSGLLSTAGGVAKDLATTFAGMGVTGLTAWASKGITDTQFLEDTQIQMQALTHSTELGNKAMAYATKYFKNNPFNRFDVTDATKQLIQFGATVEEVPALLEKMGNVSLSTGVEINELARVYQQASSDGRVGLIDIEKLAARGVPIWDAFAKATGKSANAIREETRKGGVSVNDFKKAFDYLVDEEAMKQNEKTFSRQLDRFNGRLSNMKAALAGYSMDMEKGLQIDENGLYRSVTNLMKIFSDTMSSGIGDKLLASLTKLASKISPYIDKFAAQVPKLLEMAANFIDTIADHTEMLIPILAGAMAMFGKVATGIPGLDKVIGPLGDKVGVLANKFLGLNPLLKVLVVILGAGAFKAIKDGSLNDAFKSIATSLGKLAKALAPVIARLAEMAANIGSAVLVPAINAFAKVLEVLANVIASIPEPMLTALVTGILGFMAVKKVSGPIETVTKSLRTLFGVLSVGGGFKNAFGGMKEILSTLKGVKDGKKIAEQATGTFESVKKVGQASQSAGQTLTKGQQMMKTMRSGILNLVLLAGAIVVLAYAMSLAYKAIPDDIGGLAAKLGMLAGTVTAMGTFAIIAGKVKSINTKSILTLTALALPIVAFAAAIGLVDKAIPNEFGNIAIKLGILAAAVTAFGVLSFVAGMDALNSSIVKGLLTIVGIAGTIAITALALRVAYDAMPDDFVGFQIRVGSMALVILEIGVLAAAIGFLMDIGGAAFVIPGLITMAAIAGTMTITALALKGAYEAMPDDFGGFQAKVGSLALVITEIAGLATAMGALQLFSLGTLTLGLFTLVEISATLALSAINIRKASEEMPNDMNAVSSKIKAGIEFLKEMKDAYGGSGGLLPAIGSFFWNGEGTQQFDTFIAISGKLAATASNLAVLVERMPDGTQLAGVISKVQAAVVFLMKLREEYAGEGGLIGVVKNFFYNNESTKPFDTINQIAEKLSTLASNLENLSNVSAGKLNKVVNGSLFSTLKSAVDTLKKEFGSEEGGLFHSLGSFFSNNDSTAALDNSVKIAETLGKLVDNLTKIEDVQPSKLNKAITVTIPKLKEVVTKLKDEFTEHGGLFDTIGSWFNNDDSTAKLDKAKEIAEKLAGMVDNIGKIADIDVNKLNILTGADDSNPIVKMKTVVSKLKDTFVDDADSVTNKLKDYDTGGLEKAKTVADNIKQIAETVSKVGEIELNVPGIETFITNMKTIVSKIVEQFGGDSELVNFDEQTATAINNVSSVVTNLNQMSQDLSNLQEVDVEVVSGKIDKIKQVIQKLLQVFVPDGQGETALDLSSMSDDTISSQVSQVQTIISSLKTIAQTVTEIPDVPDGITGEGGKISKIRNIIKEVVYSLDNAGEDALDLTSLSTLDLSTMPKIIQDLKSIAAGVQDFPDAATGADNLKNFVNKLSETIKTLSQEFINNGVLESLKVLGTQLTDNILTGFKEQFTANVPTSITEFYNTIKTNIDNNKASFVDRGKDVGSWLTDGVKTGLEEQKGKVWDGFRSVIDNATNGDMKWVATNQAKNIGSAMAQGVAAGINAEIWRINVAVGNISSAAVNKLKSLLGIASPSKVFYGLGEYTGEGLARGLESQVKGVQEAAQEIADAIRSPFEDLDNMTIGVSGSGAASNGGLTKYLTVNQNNNINNGMDYQTMMADLKWELFTA